MDPALSKALEKKKKLLKELEAVEKFIELFGQIFGSDEVETEGVTGYERAPKPVQVERRSKRIGKPAQIADAAEDAIRRAGRPLARGKLVEEIESAGIGIPSIDKARYVGTVLWRNEDRFINVDGKGYWIKGEALNVDPNEVDIFK